MRKYLIAFFIIGLALSSKGQSCTQLLNQAEDNYESGKLLAILKKGEAGQPSFLKCLNEGGLTHEEEIRARKLLTKVYIFTDNEAEAEISLVELLKTDPEHILDPQTDPAELFYLMQQFQTLPIFRLGIRAGVNTASPYVIGQFSTSDSYNVYNGATTDGTTPIGVFAEVIGERKLFKGLDGTLGMQYRSSSYNSQFGDLTTTTITLETNKQTYLRIPIGLKYTLWNRDRSRSILPYVFAGASYDILLSATSELSRTGGIAFTLPANKGDLVANKQVNTSNYSYYGGAGVKFRFKTHFITFDLRYDTSQKNYINSQNRLNGSKGMLFDGLYVSDDLSLNYLSVAVGYTASIHLPRKLKEYR